jgi:hypothetical protein
MSTESVHARTADADLLLPADGLRLLGQDEGGGSAGRRFLVGRGDGQVIPLPLLPYLIMAAIAEGGVDGGWSADQIGARVGSASGQGLTADTVRYLVAGKLAPLGLIAAGSADPPAGAAGAGQSTRVTLPLRLNVGGAPLGRLAARAAGRVLSWAAGRRVERLSLSLPLSLPRLLPLRLSLPRLLPLLRRRWALAVGGTAVLVCVAATAPIMAGTGNRHAGRAQSPSGSGWASRSASGSSSAAAAAAAAASRVQAAAWVAQQVSPDVTVWCDPGMCGQLRRDGFPAARVQPLPRGGRVPSGSGVVVATVVVRDQLGPRLAAAVAPQLIASFGSGAGRVDVRSIAPAGPAALRTELAAEQTALASAGRQLLGNKNIQVSASARAALSAGRVDARLLAILSLVSAQLPVRLLAFIGAPGAGSGVPLRGADIGVASPAARSSVIALLDVQQGSYRPAAVTAIGGAGQALVAVRFDAPADLNISQPATSSVTNPPTS